MSYKILNSRAVPPNGKDEGRSQMSATAIGALDRARGKQLLKRANRYLKAKNLKGWQKLLARNMDSQEVANLIRKEATQ